MAKARAIKNKSSEEEAPAPPVLVAGVTRETLEATIGRMLVMVRAIGTVAEIRAIMATVGYDAAVHQEGWDFIHAASGYRQGKALRADTTEIREAIAALDAQDEGLFRIVRATLRRHHPEQAEFVLEGIGPSVGPAAVVGVKKLLTRLDALESGPERAGTRKADEAALATLAKRGIHQERRRALAALVAKAESVSDPVDDGGAAATADKDYEQKLVAARAWYEEWSDIARSVITRRDHLIRMGLASRRRRKAEDTGDEDTGDDGAADDGAADDGAADDDADDAAGEEEAGPARKAGKSPTEK